MLPKLYIFMVALESNRKSSWWKRESLRIFCLAVLASLYGVCSYGGSPGGNHLYLQSLKPPHTRNFQNFHFRNTTNLGGLLRGWMKEIDTTGSESILKLKLKMLHYWTDAAGCFNFKKYLAEREGLANYTTENLSSQSTDELKPRPWPLHQAVTHYRASVDKGTWYIFWKLWPTAFRLWFFQSVFFKPYFLKYQTHTKPKHTISIGGYIGVANNLRGCQWAPGSQSKTIWF